jgi:WD40 repeat protein/serine/threonine protein kinase
MDEAAIFLEALQQPSPEERGAFLDQACGGNRELRHSVELLLKAHARAGDFLSAPSTGPIHDTAELASTHEAAGAVIGPYKLIERIGQGGMGTVWMAQQTEPVKRVVALKLIKAGMDSKQVIARFEAERQALALMDHANIARVLDGGTTKSEPGGVSSGRPYFVMDLVKGVPITEYCDDHHLTPRQRLELFIPVCQAIQHAHQKGIIHRDLKPSNVLVALYDGRPVPKVIDFGVAKAAGQSLTDKTLVTGFGAIVGTLEYMSPEQAEVNQLDIDTRSDIYSLGVLLYELLTGTTPFTRKDLEKAGMLEMLRVIREQEPTTPSTKLGTAEDLPTLAANRGMEPAKLTKLMRGELDWIVMKALEKDRNRRYETASAFAADIQRYLADEPVQACPPSAWYRLRKFARRNRAVLATASAIAMAVLAAVGSLGGGFAGAYWQWQRAEREYHKATELAKAEERTAYARAVALAYAEWRAGNAGTAQQMLNACRPELRGWEWHYLRRHFRVRQLATLEGHTDGVLAVAFSPDGAQIASGDADGVVTVWDRQALRATRTLREPAAVTAVAFSADGKYLGSGTTDGTVRVWDTATGKELATLRGHEPAVTGLAFDPTPPADGRAAWRLACTGGASMRSVLKLWDATNGQALVERACPSLLAAVTFSPDGKSLATAGHDGDVIGWDASTLQPIINFRGQTERIVPWASVAFSADGRWVAAGSLDGLVRVWHAATAQEFLSVLTPTQAGVAGLTFAGPDGRILAASTTDNTVLGWFTRSGKPAFTLRGHNRAVGAVTCSPDGRCLASASLDRTVRLWDIDRRDEDLTLRPANNTGVTGIAFSPDGARLASATGDRTLKVWDVVTGKKIMALPKLPAAVTGVTFSPDGSQLASADEGGTVRLRDAVTGGEITAMQGHAGRLAAVVFCPRGDTLASAGADGTVRVWNVASGLERFCLRAHGGPIHAVAFSPDTSRLASGGEDGVARVWDAATGQERLALLGHEGPVHAVAFSPDSRHLATAGHDEAVRIWDARTGALVRTMRGHTGAVRALAYSSGGRLASVGDDKAVRLWDAAGQELLALRGHTQALHTVVFSRDGHRLVSAGDDGTIKVWDGTPVDGDAESPRRGRS